jgi:uncharacterized protein YbaP (TraB family)
LAPAALALAGRGWQACAQVPKAPEGSMPAALLRPLAIAAVALAALLAPLAPARAACAGQDLLAALPGTERAALEAAVGPSPFAEGNHWLARRGTTEIALIGTYHLHDPAMDGIAPRLAPVVTGAEVLYVEATDAEVERLKSEVARDPSRLFLAEGPTLPEALPAADWQQLSAEFSARGIPPFMGAKFRPWYVAVLLALPPCLTEGGAEPREGLDRLLIDAAAAAGVPVRPLEPWDTALTLFDGLPFDRQIDMLRASLPMAGQAEDALATLAAAWRREEHRLIWEYSRHVAAQAPGADPAALAEDFATMEEALLARRNRAWIEVLLPATEGRRIAVAVGAAHLSGEAGLLQLLSDRGFSLERQPF